MHNTINSDETTDILNRIISETAQATKSVFHATINGYSSYYGCNHMVTVRITAVTIWLQTVVRL